MSKLMLSSSPHIHSGASADKIMLIVILALVPAMLASVYLFGSRAIIQYAAGISACIFFEWICTKLMKRPHTLGDLSAVVTGILLVMNLPVASPLWLSVVGAFFAIVVSKMIFGGLGSNPFNPALAARIFLLISFPAQMTFLSAPVNTWGSVDAVSSATILGAAGMYMQMHAGTLAGFEIPSLKGLFLGLSAGALGETSSLMLLAGGLILLCTRVITWHIPVAFLGTVFLLTWGHALAHPEAAIPPLVHVLSGGLLLGAFFMATDYVTSPLYAGGKILFGTGCGILTVVIRLWGNYPEGVAFAILIMNAVTPLLDKYLRPRAYGEGVV